MFDKNLIMNFSANNADGYEKFVEYYDAYKANSATVGTVSFSEADKKMKKFFSDEIARISGKKIEDFAGNEMQYCNFTDVREAAFAIVSVMTDLIIPNTIMKDFGYIAEVKNVAWGDTLRVNLRPRDLLVVSKGGRAKRSFDITRQYDGIKTIVPDMKVVTVGVALYDILTGKYTLAEFVAKAVKSIETAMRYDIWDAFTTALGTLPSTGDSQLQVTGYTQDTTIQLCQKIGAWNGSPAVIMGTKLACSKILPASTNYRFFLGDEYVRLGHVRDFFGTEVIELEQIADYTTEFKVKLPDDKLFVVSPAAQKILQVAVEGNTISNMMNAEQTANMMATGTLMKSWGVGVATSAIAGVVTLQ